MDCFESAVLWALTHNGQVHPLLLLLALLEPPAGRDAIMRLMATYTLIAQSEEGERIWWSPSTKTLWWTTVKRQAFNAGEEERDALWRMHFRMGFGSFTKLVDLLSPFIEHAATFVRQPVEKDKAVAAVLHRLGSGKSPSEMSEMYGIGASTISKYTRIVISILTDRDKLYSRYISVPAGERLVQIMARFSQLTELPGMAGAIDGTHVRLFRKPCRSRNPVEYRSRHGFPSILLQAVCDSEHLFWDVACKMPGATHDASNLRVTSLWTKMEDRGLFSEHSVSVRGRKIRPYLVGDAAYPMRTWLVKPFSARSPAEDAFNKQLWKSHNRIQTAFGMLKSRWQILNNCNTDLRYAPQVAVSCCVLHNYCILAGEVNPDQVVDPFPNSLHEEVVRRQDGENGGEQLQGSANRVALLEDWMARKTAAAV